MILWLTKMYTHKELPGLSFAWDFEPVEHIGYTDLGNYVLDMGEFNAEDIEKGSGLSEQSE